MDLTPEERKRIYLEEKARLEQPDSGSATHSARPAAATNRPWARVTPATVMIGLLVAVFLGYMGLVIARQFDKKLRQQYITQQPPTSSSQDVDKTSSTAPTPSAFGGQEGQARRFTRGMGFTAEDTARAMEAAATADPELGTPFEVLERMANAATLGVMNQQVQNSLGISEATMRDLMGLKGLEQSEFMFKYLDTELRLQVLSSAMLHKGEITQAEADVRDRTAGGGKPGPPMART